MKQKNGIIAGLLLIVSFFGFVSFGQSPALPLVTAVYNTVKSNQYVYDKLQRDYNIANPKASKWEMTYLINGEETAIASEFRTYKSQEGENLNYYWPEDRAYVVFTLTTPASTEGVTYKLPVVVEYSRIENSVLQNTWSYYWWYFDEPYEATGGTEAPELQALFLNELKSITPKVNGTYYGDELPSELKYLTSIRSIKTTGTPKRDYTANNLDQIVQNFEIKGSSIRYADYDEAETEAYYPDVTITIGITFIRDKENGKKGPWKFEKMTGNGISEELGEPAETKELYGTIMNFGFNAVYQKPSTIKPIPYTSKKYADLFEINLNAAILEFAQTGYDEKLKSFISPEHPEALTQFKTYFDELKSKCVYLGYGNSPGDEPTNIYIHLDEDPTNCYVELRIEAQRPSFAEDKTMKAQFKAAGMSKETMETGGYFDGNERLQLPIALYNNQYKLTKGPERKNPIPF